MTNDVRQDVFNALGETVHTLPEAKRLLAPVIQKHGQQAVDEVLDKFYMVVDANMTGEKFISMKVEHSVDHDPDGDEPINRELIERITALSSNQQAQLDEIVTLLQKATDEQAKHLRAQIDAGAITTFESVLSYLKDTDPSVEDDFSHLNDLDEQDEMDIEADTNFIGLDEDDNQDNRLAWTHPTWIRPTGMQEAGTCPECGREGWVSLETQDISLEYGKDGHTIRIVNGFMCTDCATFWTQTIVAKVGDVISNTVEGEATA